MDVYVHVQLLMEGQLFKEIFQEKKLNETLLNRKYEKIKNDDFITFFWIACDFL